MTQQEEKGSRVELEAEQMRAIHITQSMLSGKKQRGREIG
jgi:hypothetical protein